MSDYDSEGEEGQELDLSNVRSLPVCCPECALSTKIIAEYKGKYQIDKLLIKSYPCMTGDGIVRALVIFVKTFRFQLNELPCVVQSDVVTKYKAAADITNSTSYHNKA